MVSRFKKMSTRNRNKTGADCFTFRFETPPPCVIILKNVEFKTGNRMANLVSFGVSVEESLLDPFDRHISSQNYTNRPEAIRELTREALVKM